MKPLFHIGNLTSDGYGHQVKAGFTLAGSVVIVGSVDSCRKRAIIKTKSEFYERLVSFYFPGLVKFKVINRSELSKKNKANYQIYFSEFIYDTYFAVKTKTISSGRIEYVPAEFVYLNFKQKIKESGTYNYIDGTGLACHNSTSESIKHGLLEVIERDQIAKFWYLKLALAKEIINYDKYLKREQKQIILKLKYRIKIILLENLLSAGLFVVIAIVYNYNDKICFGSSCALTLRTAINKAIFEGIMLHDTMNIFIKNKKRISASIDNVFAAYYNASSIEKYLRNKIVPEDKNYEVYEKKGVFKISKIIKYFNEEPVVYAFPNPYNSLKITRVIISSAFNKFAINNKISTPNKIFHNLEIPYPFG